MRWRAAFHNRFHSLPAAILGLRELAREAMERAGSYAAYGAQRAEERAALEAACQREQERAAAKRARLEAYLATLRRPKPSPAV